MYSTNPFHDAPIAPIRKQFKSNICSYINTIIIPETPRLQVDSPYSLHETLYRPSQSQKIILQISLVSQDKPSDVPPFADHNREHTVFYIILRARFDSNLHATVSCLNYAMNRFQRRACVDLHPYMRRTAEDGGSDAYGGMAEHGGSTGYEGVIEPELDKRFPHRSKNIAIVISRLV